MGTSANVRSLEAITSVKTALVQFSDRVEQALTILESEMRRVQEWLEHDCPRYWKQQVHQANDDLAQARAELHRCLMFPIADERPSCMEERAAVKRAEARLEYCVEKVERVKHWIAEINREKFEYQGRASRLAGVTEIDVPRAIGVLAKLVERLEEYHASRPNQEAPVYDGVRMVRELFEDVEQDQQETPKDQEIPDDDDGPQEG